MSLLWLVPAVPLLGALLLGFLGQRLARGLVILLGVGSVGAAAAIALWVGADFMHSPPPDGHYIEPLWRWFTVGEFAPRLALYLDPLSLVMMLVITFVAFLIHLYSAQFMAGEEGYSRFFAYMNLFVASMVVLVLADNLLLLYLGWEGVGLCSYLLIGFWYRDAANGLAARKAFIVTRVGDTAFALGLFLLITALGTLDIQAVLQRAAAQWSPGSGLAVAATALLLAGAVGKSAQIPLQVWLPDAMAGPTPVSALIHAATMVTAGVYLLARLHGLYALAPVVQGVVALLGSATLLLAAFSAWSQTDIKRVLAYSTISQIGYMFLALGVGAWIPAIFHFMTHAFFKALLFLGAGSIIMALRHEHDIFKMGGLSRRLPLTFWTFLAGAASLASVPFLTAGFYSKEQILISAWSADVGGFWLFAGGVVAAFVTAAYIFRMVFVVFFGEPRTSVGAAPGLPMAVPMVILAVLSLGAGVVDAPALMGALPTFSQFLQPTPSAPAVHTVSAQWVLQAVAAVASLGGILFAYQVHRHVTWVGRLRRWKAAQWFRASSREGWGFDALYTRLFVVPYVRFAAVNRRDALDWPYMALAAASRWSHLALSRSQSGALRRYAAVASAGVALILAVAIFT